MGSTDEVIKNLKRNGFDVYFASTPEEALKITSQHILPSISFRTVSYADSMTMKAVGILDKIREETDFKVIETFSPSYSFEEKLMKRREALLADVFFTGTNALTVDGKIVNLDMIGNRVAAITFGPRYVILFIGINKLVKNIQEAYVRIKSISAPNNAIRHNNFKLPCQKTGKCMNCSSSDRICNYWTVTEKSFPKGRIKIVLIDQSLGL